MIANDAEADFHTQVATMLKTGDAVAQDILKSIYPDDTPRIERRIDRAKALVYFVGRGADKEVLRLSVSPYHVAQHLAAAYESWAHVGVPIPTVKAVGAVGSVQYLLMSYIPEPTFDFDMPPAVQLELASQMGSLLARMRSVQAEGFGYLDDNHRGTSATWNEFICQRHTYDWISRRDYLNPVELAALHQITDTIDFPAAESVLLHGDYKPKNMFVTASGTITAVTDPNPMAGDPLYDFATCNHFVYRGQARQNKPFDDSFFAGMRNAFRQSYEQSLGSSLDADELHRIACYGILIDARNTEKMLRHGMDETVGESDHMLSYLRRKIQLLDS